MSERTTARVNKASGSYNINNKAFKKANQITTKKEKNDKEEEVRSSCRWQQQLQH